MQRSSSQKGNKVKVTLAFPWTVRWLMYSRANIFWTILHEMLADIAVVEKPAKTGRKKHEHGFN